MKQYFEEHMIDIEPPKEWVKQKLRECIDKQENGSKI